MDLVPSGSVTVQLGGKDRGSRPAGGLELVRMELGCSSQLPMETVGPQAPDSRGQVFHHHYTQVFRLMGEGRAGAGAGEGSSLHTELLFAQLHKAKLSTPSPSLTSSSLSQV